jgi:prevent-host-death family protein
MEISGVGAGDKLAETIERVANKGKRIVLTSKRKPVAAIVSMDDLAALEKLEDQADLRAARRAKAEMKRKGEKGIPLEEVKKRLGIR